MIEADRFVCPACGYPDLDKPMRDEHGIPSHRICPCCGFQGGHTDDSAGHSYQQWRERWVGHGMRWRDDIEPPPSGWDTRAQLMNLDASSGDNGPDGAAKEGGS